MSHTTRVLVTGGSGIMASALRAYFPYGTFLGKDECDVTNPGQVRMAFSNHNPEVVIHCAAITAYDAEPMAYVMGNVVGTVQVVAQARKCGARVVYLSTDYLSAHRESDAVQPIGLYAASKYAGEACCSPVANSLVVRGSWYSYLQYEYAPMDAFTSRIPVHTAAYFVATLAVSSHTGVVNIGGARRSQYEIALEQNEQVVPCSRLDFDLPYTIPADCSLDTSRLRRLMAA